MLGLLGKNLSAEKEGVRPLGFLSFFRSIEPVSLGGTDIPVSPPPPVAEKQGLVVHASETTEQTEPLRLPVLRPPSPSPDGGPVSPSFSLSFFLSLSLSGCPFHTLTCSTFFFDNLPIRTAFFDFLAYFPCA